MNPKILLPLLKNLLDPGILQPSLVRTGLYLTVYEILVEMLIGFPESLRIAKEPSRYQPSKEFRFRVVPIGLVKRKEFLKTSLRWWREHSALTEEDQLMFGGIEDYRHDLAHEMMAHLLQNDFSVWQLYYQEMIKLLVKLDDWWCLNGNGIVANENIDPGGEVREILLQNRVVIMVMTEATIGDKSKARELLEEFQKRTQELKRMILMGRRNDAWIGTTVS